MNELLAHMDLINIVARSYYGRLLTANPAYDVEDLVNELVIVMMRCINRHDPAQRDLRTFSRRRLYGHVLDLIRAQDQVKIPRSVWKKCKTAPLDGFYKLFSIDKLMLDEEKSNPLSSTLFDNHISAEEQLLLKEFAATCLSAFNRLKSDRTKAIILSHVFHGHTFESLVDLFYVTETRLCQITNVARRVMLARVKKSYPNICRVQGMNKPYTVPKTDKQLSTSLTNIGIYELIRFVTFLTRDEK